MPGKMIFKYGLEFVGEDEIEVYSKVRELVGERGLKPLILELLRVYLTQQESSHVAGS